MKVPISPSTTSWAAFTPAPIEELQAINRSCSPWVETRADPTLPAPRSTCMASDNIAEYKEMGREEGVKLQGGGYKGKKVIKVRKYTPGRHFETKRVDNYRSGTEKMMCREANQKQTKKKNRSAMITRPLLFQPWMWLAACMLSHVRNTCARFSFPL